MLYCSERCKHENWYVLYRLIMLHAVNKIAYREFLTIYWIYTQYRCFSYVSNAMCLRISNEWSNMLFLKLYRLWCKNDVYSGHGVPVFTRNIFPCEQHQGKRDRDRFKGSIITVLILPKSILYYIVILVNRWAILSCLTWYTYWRFDEVPYTVSCMSRISIL